MVQDKEMGETWMWIFLRFYPIKTFKMKKKSSRDTLVTRLILHLDYLRSSSENFLSVHQVSKLNPGI